MTQQEAIQKAKEHKSLEGRECTRKSSKRTYLIKGIAANIDEAKGGFNVYCTFNEISSAGTIGRPIIEELNTFFALYTPV